MRIIDTHIHIWDLNAAHYAWLDGNTTLLNQSYAIEALNAVRSGTGVTHGILVQAANHTLDTDLMLACCEKEDWLCGVVGWLPLIDPEQTGRLLEDRYLKNKYFKGCRHLIHDEPDPRWLLQDRVLESLSLLASHHIPYDVVGILPEHIRTVLTLAEKIPGLNMVFDHLNHPPVGNHGRDNEWFDLMKAAAGNPRLYTKISGLGTIATGMQMQAAVLRPLVRFALDHFGIDRCFCGGDWPVCLLGASYEQTWKTYQQIWESELTVDERESVYVRNAKDFYQLDAVE